MLPFNISSRLIKLSMARRLLSVAGLSTVGCDDACTAAVVGGVGSGRDDEDDDDDVDAGGADALGSVGGARALSGDARVLGGDTASVAVAVVARERCVEAMLSRTLMARFSSHLVGDVGTAPNGLSDFSERARLLCRGLPPFSGLLETSLRDSDTFHWSHGSTLFLFSFIFSFIFFCFWLLFVDDEDADATCPEWT